VILRKKRRNELPRYTYKCKVCLEYFEVSHSISDKLTDCGCGEKGSLTRVPSVPFNITLKDKQKTGQVVREFIDDSKKEIEEYKEEMVKGVEDE
jgi:putative FmdB family regulatory protein